MSARDITPLGVPNSNAESRREEEAQQTGKNLPTASMPWSEIDLSFLLLESDHRANEHVLSLPQPAFSRDFAQHTRVSSEPRPMQAANNNINDTQNSIWYCRDGT
jgi:hypothetical protein